MRRVKTTVRPSGDRLGLEIRCIASMSWTLKGWVASAAGSTEAAHSAVPKATKNAEREFGALVMARNPNPPLLDCGSPVPDPRVRLLCRAPRRWSARPASPSAWGST